MYIKWMNKLYIVVNSVFIFLRNAHTHTQSAIFPGEPGLASCPLNSPSPFIPGLHILLGQA